MSISRGNFYFLKKLMPYKNRQQMQDYLRRWRKENPQYYKDWRKENPDYYPQYSMNYRKKYPEKIKKYKKMFRITHPHLYEDSKKTGAQEAMHKVRRAIFCEKLPSLSKQQIKCNLCCNRATQYHHYDYNKPLDVVPVCVSCNVKFGKAIPVS